MKNKWIFGISAFLLFVASYLSLTRNSMYGITNFIWLVILFPLIAYSLSSILINKKINLGERIVYSVGLLISLLMLLGLLLNVIGLLLHHSTLTPHFIVPCFDIIFLMTLALAVKRKIPFLNFSSLKVLRKPFIFIPLLFPIISLLGVIQLNNGGSNSFAILNLCLIALYLIYFFFKSGKRSELEYISNIFFISLSLVLSFSMRSNHIIGSDINQEYQLFSAVLRNGIWHPHQFNSTYNACLSITILPTVLKSFIQSSAEYIFKFYMQLILCVIPVVVYVIARRILNTNRLAFLASLFFLIQAQYITEFTALIRQQSAMLFFGLIFVVASSKTLSKRMQSVLILIFGFSMVASHYSSAYVGIAFLLIVVFLKYLYSKLRLFNSATEEKRAKVNEKWHFSPLIVIILLLFAFCWFGEVLQETGGVMDKFITSITSFDSYFAADSRSSFIANDLHIGNARYSTNTLSLLEQSNQVVGGYQPTVYNSVTVMPTSPNGPDINTTFKSLAYRLAYDVIPLLIKLIVIIGAIVLFVSALKKRRDIEEGLFVIASGILFILLVALPFISQDYNVERLYQQLLIVVSATFVLGVKLLLNKWPRLVPGLSLALILIYFVCTTNLAYQVFLGFSDVNLMNNGNVYDKFYVQDGERDSLTWLQNHSGHSKINVDLYGSLQVNAFTSIPSSKYVIGMLPDEILANGFVYATNSNINKDLVYDKYNSLIISYSFPSQLLNQQKNLVYVNGASAIYR